MNNFNDIKLDLTDIINGGDIVSTNEGCPDEADYYDTVTHRYSYPCFISN